VGDAATIRPLSIDLLHWSGCPSLPEARGRLDAALERAGAEAVVREREVVTVEDAARLGFYGSPTILVDGRDVEPPPRDAVPALGCRIYSAPGGRVGPVPARDVLDRAIEEAIARCRS
jgi:hypothetical protein